MSLKVLIVDDSLPVRLTLKRILAQIGIPDDQIFLAENATEGLDFFHRFEPDVVFLDVELGDTDGAPGDGAATQSAEFGPVSAKPRDGGDLAHKMLARDPRLKIVVCTGLGRESEQVAQMIREGIFEVITKPVRADKVREAMRLAVEEGLNFGPHAKPA
jgi:CheY-like chemotaxis protein